MIKPRALAGNKSNPTQLHFSSRSRGLCVLARFQQQQQQQRKGSKAPQQPTQASLRSVSTQTVVKPAAESDCTCPEPCSDAAEGATSPSALTAAADAPWAGPLFVACGAFVCSFISLQIKLFDHPLPPLQVTAFSSAVAWLATSIIMRAKGVSPNGGCAARSLRSAGLLMLRGLLAATTVVCYYSSIESLPLPVAVGLFFFNPVFCLMLDAAVADRHVPPAAIASCLLTVLGVLAIGWHDQMLWLLEQAFPQLQQLPGLQPAAVGSGAFPAADLPIEGVLFGLAAAAANAAAFVCVGVIGPKVSPLCLTWWQHLVVTHVAVGAIFFRNLGPLEFRFGSSSTGGELAALGSSISGSISSGAGGWGSMCYDVLCGLALDASDALADLADALPSQHDCRLLLGVVAANFFGQLLLNLGFQRVDAGRGAAINTSQVLFGCVWDVTLLHSHPSMAMLLGSGAIAAGVAGSTATATRSSGSSSSSSSTDAAAPVAVGEPQE